MCVLMLRGPQTPGELKQRAERMHAFADLDAVQETLEQLIERELVERLPRRPGQKEERYRQLLGERQAEGGDATDGSRCALSVPEPGRAERRGARATWPRAWRALEREVAELRADSTARRLSSAVSAAGSRRESRGAAPGRILGHGHRRRHPGRARRRARVVPLALRAAARAGLPLDGDRRDAGRPQGGRGHPPGARAEPAVHRELLGDLHPAGPERDGDRLDAEHAQTRSAADRRCADHR